MEKIENEYADYVDDDPYAGIPDFPDEVPESFDKLISGLQDDGTVLSDLGWASMHLCEDLGIEGVVGISGFESEHHFIDWVRDKINLRLGDWEPISVSLHQCWYQADDHCYMVWRSQPPTDALNVNPINVYALRHVDFHLKDGICLSAFYVARQHSLGHDVWVNKHGDTEFKPESMDDYLHHGYHLSGKAPNSDHKKNLTWPSHDLPAMLATLDSFHANGYTDLHIWSEGIGFRFEDINPRNKTRLVHAYHCYGADEPFIDLATAAGIR